MNKESTTAHIKWFRDSAPYINAHRNKLAVLMIDGDAIAHNRIKDIIHDVALLVSLGVRLVIVHGARVQIETQLVQQGIQCAVHDNLRVTDKNALDCVKQAVGAVRHDMEALLSMGLENSPMHGARLKVCSGNFVIAKPIGIVDGVDFHHTGEVRRIDVNAIKNQLDQGFIVLLPPLGYSPTGETFNLLAEQLATETAKALDADKLILMCGPDGAVGADGKTISHLSTSEATQLISLKQQPAEIHNHLKAACDACEAGIQRAHLVSYKTDGALLSELYTRDGAGTMITVESYEQMRRADAQDVSGIIALIRPLEKQGVLVRRSRELLENEVEQFTIIERDGTIIGCAALYPFPEPENKAAELACFAVHPEYRNADRGGQLLRYVCQRAKKLGIERLAVLTTQTAHWFIERGFVKTTLDNLPPSKQALYNWQRNSSVFEKEL